MKMLQLSIHETKNTYIIQKILDYAEVIKHMKGILDELQTASYIYLRMSLFFGHSLLLINDYFCTNKIVPVLLLSKKLNERKKTLTCSIE